MIRAGVVGGSGYTGGELLRLLLGHTEVEIDFVYSRTKNQILVSDVHPDLLGLTNLRFANKINANADVVFLCLGHGNSKIFLEENSFASHTAIIDLSNDFRLKGSSTHLDRDFIYGLPELHKEKIQKAQFVANPGCFATAIQLALLPLTKSNHIHNEVHVNAITGSTGAGVIPGATTHFSWRNNNVSWYKPFKHQHLAEVLQSLNNGQSDVILNFLPVRGNFSRGIFATAYTHFEQPLEAAVKQYEDFYRGAAFTKISSSEIYLKQVVNTNYCHLHLLKHENKLLITSIIDNLLKGASGQAVQNMNLMFGFREDEALRLKSSFF